jgi:hypothetical protein
MWPSPFKYHTDTYPAIDLSSPRLSTKEKNIVVSGGSLGIDLAPSPYLEQAAFPS